MLPRPRWLASILFLLGAPGVAIAQVAPASPPGPRQFGPDHTATGVFTGAGVVPAGLACDAPADPAAPPTCEGFLGTLLETTVRVPRSGGLHPLAVAMHGWGGSRGSTAKYDAPLLAAGYDVLRYSACGFGGSFGQTNLADVNVEGADLRSLVGQVVDDGRLAADASAVPVFGASYASPRARSSSRAGRR